MAALPEYTDRGPITIPPSLNLSSLAGKSVLITGGGFCVLVFFLCLVGQHEVLGGSGLGKAYAEAFAKAG